MSIHTRQVVAVIRPDNTVNRRYYTHSAAAAAGAFCAAQLVMWRVQNADYMRRQHYRADKSKAIN